MYSLLIADDEPIIAGRMRDVFSETGMFDVHCFFNGIQALKFAREHPVDLALLDICMPCVNGMSLMHTLKSLWPDIYIVFLTGYRKFEYAYESLEENNVKYVLKSDGEQKIKETVFSCAQKIAASRKQAELLENSQLIIRKFAPQILSDYFSQLLTNRTAPKTAEFVLTQQNISREDLYTLVLCGIEEDQPTGLKLQLYYHLMQLSDQMINLEHVTFSAPQPHRFCIALKHSDDVNLSDITDLFEKLENIFYKTYCTGFSVLIANKPCVIDDISFNYRALSHVLDAHPNMELLMQTDTDIFEGESGTLPCKAEVLIDDLHEAILNSNEEEFAYCSLELLSLAGDSNMSREKRLLIERKLLPLCIEMQTQYQTNFFNEKALSSMSIAELADVLAGLNQAVLDKKHSRFNKKSNEVIGMVNQYVSEHLDENLSLENLAKCVYLNPSYLSRLYKQTAGVNLSDYIVQQRIDYAKMHLVKTDEKIATIASALGFKTASYFAVFFKKNTDFSPTEYREKHSK